MTHDSQKLLHSFQLKSQGHYSRIYCIINLFKGVILQLSHCAGLRRYLENISAVFQANRGPKHVLKSFAHVAVSFDFTFNHLNLVRVGDIGNYIATWSTWLTQIIQVSLNMFKLQLFYPRRLIKVLEKFKPQKILHFYFLF